MQPSGRTRTAILATRQHQSCELASHACRDATSYQAHVVQACLQAGAMASAGQARPASREPADMAGPHTDMQRLQTGSVASP